MTKITSFSSTINYADHPHKTPQEFYHGSVHNFEEFDVNKIRPDETDAVYNGFWFTSEKSSASPAWRDPNYIRTCHLKLFNPAPHSIVRQVYQEVKDKEGPGSICDKVRLTLLDRGYDGVIHEDIPVIDREEFQRTGKTDYRTARGTKYTLKVDEEYGGVDLYRGDDHITGYTDLDDFMNLHQERVLVIFNPKHITTLKIEEYKR